jgi:glycosyltransferase involved in cell wall biosynthesis
MKKPKVALIVSHPIQHFCPAYANWAKSTDYDFKVFFMSALGFKPYNDESFGKEIVWGNLYLDQFDHYFKSNEAKKVTKDENAGVLLEELKSYQPDVVIGYGYAHKFQREIKAWTKNQGSKYYYVSDSENNNKESLIKRSLKKQFVSKYFKNIDRFLTVGTANEIYYTKNNVPLRKLTRLNFSIDVLHYDRIYEARVAERYRIRKKHNLSDTDFVTAMVGKLIDKKRQLDLIKSLSLIDSDQFPKITCFIIGTGEDSAKLKEAAKKLHYQNVIFTDFVKPEELSSYYAACTVYTHTASYEPHSLAISEAIYLGIPCIISSNCGSYGPHDDIIDGYSGSIYDYSDTKQLSNLWLKLVDDKEEVKKFSSRSVAYSRRAQKLAHGKALEIALKADKIL